MKRVKKIRKSLKTKKWFNIYFKFRLFQKLLSIKSFIQYLRSTTIMQNDKLGVEVGPSENFKLYIHLINRET